MLVKTSELQGAALDWVVAKCEGKNPSLFLMQRKETPHHYSTDWSQGGPIIEREKIQSSWCGGFWECDIGSDNGLFKGDSPLIAAMRCFVASKLGEEVDIPEGL